jgi:TMEM175 potassium channel family protein
MTKGRLEAFSDGVIAILITIMVLELHPPHVSGEQGLVQQLHPLLGQLLGYLLSFVFLGIYWNNHHHMLHVTERVSGWILWANLHLLFWLSLVPFVTSWIAASEDTGIRKAAFAVYGFVLLMAGVAYSVLRSAIIRQQGPGSRLAALTGRDIKGKVSVVLYTLAIPFAFVSPWIAGSLYVVVALMWLVPDRRIESKLAG